MAARQAGHAEGGDVLVAPVGGPLGRVVAERPTSGVRAKPAGDPSAGHLYCSPGWRRPEEAHSLAAGGGAARLVPNGRWIAFRSKESSEDSGNVWLVHPDGTGRHPVTHTPAGSGKWGSPSFSSNGRRITAGKYPGRGAAGNADVYVVHLDGSHRHNVTKSFAYESAADWGPQAR
jgi:hypothetical protein